MKNVLMDTPDPPNSLVGLEFQDRTIAAPQGAICPAVAREDYRDIAAMLRLRCGLAIGDHKRSLLGKAISARMESLRLETIDAYRSHVKAHTDEVIALASHVTVGETYFHRHDDHWRALQQCVLPWIVAERQGNGDREIRFWSAGCSSGEEAYTIAFLAHDFVRRMPQWRVRVRATDLNGEAIAAARRGVYGERSFRGLPAAFKRRYFREAAPGRYEVRPLYRSMVEFRQANLLDDTTADGSYDVVFCRNVLIYFDQNHGARAIANFRRCLRAGGYLFVGHAERLRVDANFWAAVNACGSFFYRVLPECVERESEMDSTRFQHRRMERSREQAARDEGQPAVRTLRGELSSDLPVRSGRRDLDRDERSCRAEGRSELDQLRARAESQLIHGPVPENAALFRQVLELDPRHVPSLLGLALLAESRGESECALDFCDRAIRWEPTCSEAYCVRAMVLENEGRLEEAAADLRKAVYCDERNVMAHFRSGCLYRNLQERPLAARHFRSALAMLNDDLPNRLALLSGGFDTATLRQMCEEQLATFADEQEFE